MGTLLQSSFGTKFTIPEDTSGGSYTIKVEHQGHGLPSAERKIEIRAFQNPRLNSQLEFVKKGYGAGETASATLSVKRAEGGVPVGAQITYTARVDGQEVFKGTTLLNSKGNCVMQFQLPKTISVGDGTLTCVIKDGGVVETASKTIPILLCSINCDVYPEGGDLIAGLNCGLYIEASTPFGEPADLQGEIIDSKGKAVANIATQHEGRGKTYFVPKLDEGYSLKVTKPSGITNLIKIPLAIKSGVSLVSSSDVFKAQEALKFRLSSTSAKKFKVSIFKRDLELTSLNVTFDKELEEKEVIMTLPDKTDADGVLRVLISDVHGKPLSERLIFRTPLNSIKVSITPDYKSYCPGTTGKMNIVATDWDGKPVSTFLAITVTDESVLESQEKRKQPPRLPTMVFLEQEVSNLEDAKLYLSEDPKADVAVDLLLGTQGWRRFAFDKSSDVALEKMERIAVFHQGMDPPCSDSDVELDDLEWEEEGMGKGMGFEDYSVGGMVPQMMMPVRNEMMDFMIPPEIQDEKMIVPAPLMAPQMAPKLVAPIIPKAIEAQLDLFAGLVQKRKLVVENKEKQMDKKDKEMPELKKKAKLKEENVFVREMEAEMEEMEQREFQEDDTWSSDHESFNDGPPVVFRVYAHTKRSDRRAGDRVDFTETLYWNACVKTNKQGKAAVTFDFSDSITSYRVIVDAFSRKGLFGSGERLVESKEPFYVEPKLPLEVTSGDLIQLPVVVVNSSMEDLSITLKNSIAKFIQIDGNDTIKLDVKSEQRKRVLYNLKVGNGNSSTEITLHGASGPFSDKVTRSINVVPKGFPMSVNDGGMLKEPRTMQFTIQDSVEKSSITSSILFMPSPSASLTSAMEMLMREPHGCFEQTSTTTYPTIIAHQYLISHLGVDPSLIQKSYALIEKGYKRLITFECKSGGYEWFGSGPGHEALTAYGTLEFMDMSKVYPVDQAMLKRTKDWLYSRRDGKGGFLRNTKALDDFGGAPDDVTNAYIVWSLTEAGEKGLDAEVDALYKQCDKKDTYFLGLVAGALFNVGKTKEYAEIATKIISMQESNGSVLNSKTTITQSGGNARVVETTAISLLIWLNDDDKFSKNTESAMTWLLSQVQGGKYGSTQGTILALKAIVKYDKARAKPLVDGFATIKVGKHDPIKVDISKDATGTIVSPSISSLIATGSNTVEISLSSGLYLPFAFTLDYYAGKPDSSDKCVIDFSTKISSTKFTEGSGGEIDVFVKNLSKEKVGMTIAIIGLPGGMEPRHDQLKELVKSEKISCYEIRGREVIFYWRGMKEEQEITVKIDVIARIPGKYKGPSSRAYLYYTDEFKKWVDGSECEIAPE